MLAIRMARGRLQLQLKLHACYCMLICFQLLTEGVFPSGLVRLPRGRVLCPILVSESKLEDQLLQEVRDVQ